LLIIIIFSCKEHIFGNKKCLTKRQLYRIDKNNGSSAASSLKENNKFFPNTHSPILAKQKTMSRPVFNIIKSNPKGIGSAI